jgi:hypothetical protein
VVVGKFNDSTMLEKRHVPQRENTYVHYVHPLQLVFELASHPKKPRHEH